MNRRDFLGTLGAGILSFALLESLVQTRAYGRSIAPIVDHWALRLQAMCMDLRQSHITAAAWQSQVEELFRAIPLVDVLRFIDFEQLQKGMDLPDLGVATKRVVFPKLEGLPADTVFVKKLFGMRRDRAVIPHGHSNMASAHLLLAGSLHMRHYDKVSEEAGALVIRPTLDRVSHPGEITSISDLRDNVHWFVARSEQAFTLDVIMLDLAGRPYDIHNLDMDAASKASHDCLRVPKLNVDEALKKYGKHHH